MLSFPWVDDFEPVERFGVEVPDVARNERQVVGDRNCGNLSVCAGHDLTGLLRGGYRASPDDSSLHIEGKNALAILRNQRIEPAFEQRPFFRLIEERDAEFELGDRGGTNKSVLFNVL